MVRLTAKKREVEIVWRTVICNGDEAEREQILEYAHHYGKERQQPVRVGGRADWQGLAEQPKEREPDVVIVTQSGVAGINIITSAHLSPRKYIWFSDLDFAIQAYQLCLGWLGIKPVTYGKVEQALSRRMGGEIKTGNIWK